eukprot:3820359-Rhodomonas_salina.1
MPSEPDSMISDQHCLCCNPWRSTAFEPGLCCFNGPVYQGKKLMWRLNSNKNEQASQDLRLWLMVLIFSAKTVNEPREKGPTAQHSSLQPNLGGPAPSY